MEEVIMKKGEIFTPFFVLFLLFMSSIFTPQTYAQEADLIYGSGGMVTADEEIIIGDRGDYFWMYENESGDVVGKFHTGYEKWDEMTACDVNGDG
ncbi:hypothetical protein, partial [Palaeococcus sp. (in: euryarchaeotes)]